MAEIQSQTQSRHVKGGRLKRKIHSLKVDLTPMVDLGFLLITFFVITTSMREPKAAELLMPKDSDIITEIPVSTALTVILQADDQIAYYHGTVDTAKIHTTGFKGIRDVIINKQKAVARKTGDRKDVVLIIKSDTAASYKNLVDMLDEVMINGITRYFLAELSVEEKSKL